MLLAMKKSAQAQENKQVGKKRRPVLGQAGMSYIELIVVLSIFSVMTSVVLFNYGDFQAKVDIKNLASDIALKVVEAQKMSLSGQFPPQEQYNLISSPSTWKPSYGVYMDLSEPGSFIYFANVLDPGSGLYETPPNCTDECLDEITITKGNTISGLTVFYQGGGSEALNDLNVTFTRPNSATTLKSSTAFSGTVSYVQVSIASPKGVTSDIKFYPSGRIQVN